MVKIRDRNPDAWLGILKALVLCNVWTIDEIAGHPYFITKRLNPDYALARFNGLSAEGGI
jgi:hypothetical protein